MSYKNTYKGIGPIGSGITTSLVMACKGSGASLVCVNQQHARDVHAEFNIPTTTLDTNVKGLKGPFIFDHHAVDVMSDRYEQEIGDLKKQLADVNSLRQGYKAIVDKELLQRIDIALFKAGVVAEIEGLDDAEEITNLRNALSEYDV